jgi:hypothetical protein
MPRACTVCGHPQRHEIEQAMLAREPFRAIARRFGLSKDALLRHHDDHLPAALVEASRIREITRADDLVDRVIGLARETQAVLERAKAAGDDKLVLAAIATAGRQLELQVRLLGQLQETATVNIVLSGEWIGLKAQVVAALDPFPEARLAVAAALEGGHHALAARC